MNINFEKMELVQDNYNDLRFGVVSVYIDPSTSKLIMLKEKQSSSEEEHRITLGLTKERFSLSHPNILKMLAIESNEELFVTQAYFEYPNSDINEYKEQLKNPYEFLRFIYDILSAMAYLEKARTIHGNIRPEFIYYNNEDKRYVLVDRLGDINGPIDTQRDNIESRNRLYMDPLTFSDLIKGKTNVASNPFKNEVFCFAMVALSMLCDDDELQNVYDYFNLKFNLELLKDIVKRVRNIYFWTEETSIIGDFLFFYLLSVNESERLSAKKAERLISTTLSGLLKGQEETENSARNNSPRNETAKDNHIAPLKFTSKKNVQTNMMSQGDIRLSEALLRQKPNFTGISDMSIDVAPRLSSLKRDYAEDIEFNDFEPKADLNLMNQTNVAVAAENEVDREAEEIKAPSKKDMPAISPTIADDVGISSKKIVAVSSKRGLEVDYDDEFQTTEEVDFFLTPEEEQENNKHTAELLQDVDKQIETSVKKLQEHENLSAKLNSLTHYPETHTRFSKKLSAMKVEIPVSEHETGDKIITRKSVEADANTRARYVESRRMIVRNAKTPDIKRESNQQYAFMESKLPLENETANVLRMEDDITRNRNYGPLKVITNEHKSPTDSFMANSFDHTNLNQNNKWSNTNEQKISNHQADNTNLKHVIVRSVVQNYRRPSGTLPQIPNKEARTGLGINKNDLVLVRIENGKEIYRYRQDLNK